MRLETKKVMEIGKALVPDVTMIWNFGYLVWVMKEQVLWVTLVDQVSKVRQC
jgi:hypothetical protein